MPQAVITRVVIIGGGPVGLLLGSLLRDQNVDVTILEKRSDITRTRCVKLLGRILLSNAITDEIFLFSEEQIEERQQAIESMKLELFDMVTGWLELFTPIQTIQEALKNYCISSGAQLLTGDEYDISKNLTLLQRYPNTVVIDCTGYHSVLREHIQPNNRISRLIEHVIVCTFILDDRYECNELCKYYKNINTKRFQCIPSIDDTYRTRDRETHVTCLITIDEPMFQEVSKIRPITYDYLREQQHEIYNDLNIFLNNLSSGIMDHSHFDTMEFVALPLQVYRGRKLTHTVSSDNLNQHWILMGGPYFQSISMGYEAAIYFAYLFRRMKQNIPEMMTKYEAYMDKLWLAMQIRSKEIQRNKQILQAMCLNNRDDILTKIKIY
ncbi:unnamed protein product [Rotaria sp. Silwood1]|nr:unnamed protein product [Rotaria sp. Silwood1]